MLVNDSNRAPLKDRIKNAVVAGILFTSLFEIKNYFWDNEPFNWELTLGSFLIFTVLALIMNFFTLKKKDN